MSIAFRMFANGTVAIFEEPNTTGDPFDIDAPRNAPAKTPASHLGALYYHSTLDLLEVLAAATVNVNHAAVPAAGAPPGVGLNTIFAWAGATANHLLMDLTAYNLTREPFCIVAVGSKALIPGMPVQTFSDGRARYATVYSTTTQVRLWETASKTSSILPATTLAYQILVFRDPPGPLTNLLWSYNETTGAFTMGQGQFDSSKRYLQVAPGGSPLSLSLGRTIDLKNGAPRFIQPDGTVINPVPAVTAYVTPGTNVPGASMAYNGSFVDQGSVQVQAP